VSFDTEFPPRQDHGHADFHDPSLSSQSPVFLEERGARITDVRILTANGKPVNILQMGNRYVVEYRVAFSRPASSIDFGIWFRTPSGLGLAGAQTEKARAYTLAAAEPGQSVLVRYKFDARLTPGTYFLSCGVIGNTSEGRVVLHRVYDIEPIRIAAESDLLATGYFDLNPEPEISPVARAAFPLQSDGRARCAR
jgi:lipopolysaccharide transport system ATP-binding protein